MATIHVKRQTPSWYKKFYDSRVNQQEIVVFDIGACKGEAFMEEAKLRPNLTVFAFEPQRDLYQAILDKTSKLPNYHVVNDVVSNYTGQAWLNVCPDLGCSSIHDFNVNVDKTWKVDDAQWKRKRVAGKDGFRCFEYTDSYVVNACRLDSFIKRVNRQRKIDSQPLIDKIDFLHVDAQGEDLNVLRGLGEYLNWVDSGMVECCMNEKVSLYANAKENTKEAVLYFLHKNGFKVIMEYPDGGFLKHETNYVFKKI